MYLFHDGSYSSIPKSNFSVTDRLLGVSNVHLSFAQGGGHGGSHPHLAHEFLMALVEDRDPFPNAGQSANWTSVGILAHESAMKGGEIIKVPDFFNV